jgi:hypothetical protein
VLTRDKVNVFEYDVGLGGGARTYAYEAGQLSDKTCAAG